MPKISLKCTECGGILDINDDKSVLFCPYCGSKTLIEESDDVKMKKIDREINIDNKKFAERKAVLDMIKDNLFIVEFAAICFGCIILLIITGIVLT